MAHWVAGHLSTPAQSSTLGQRRPSQRSMEHVSYMPSLTVQHGGYSARFSSPFIASSSSSSSVAHPRTPGRPRAPSATLRGSPKSPYLLAGPSPQRSLSFVVPPGNQPEGIASVDGLIRPRLDPLSRSLVDVKAWATDKAAHVIAKPTSSASASTSATSGTPEATPPEGPVDNASYFGVSARAGRLPDAPARQHQPQWAVTQSFMLKQCEHGHLFEHVALLDRNQVSSVNRAVEQLNEGSLSCRNGYCIVYSVSSRAHFLLYRDNMRDFAISLISSSGEPRTGPFAPQKDPQVPSLPGTLRNTLVSDTVKPSDTASRMGAPVRVPPPFSQPGPAVASSQQFGMSLKEQRPGGGCQAMSPKAQTSTPRSRRSSSVDVNRMASMGQASLWLERTLSSPSNRSDTRPGSLRSIQRTGSGDASSSCHDGFASKRPSADDAKEFTPIKHYSLSLASISDTPPPSSPEMLRLQRDPSTPQSPTSDPACSKDPASFLSSAQRLKSRAEHASLTQGPAIADEEGDHIVKADGDGDHTVKIGRLNFNLLKIIGRGAFGVVWRARDLSNGREDVAVKVVTAKDSAAFATASFEAELLQILSAGMGGTARQHVPQYISHSASRADSSSGRGTVRLAMSFVPGGALDMWLYGICDEEHKTIDAAQLVDGHLPGGQQGSWELLPACAIVRELILQLSGVFAALQPIAYHRDVSSHNVLFQSEGIDKSLNPKFALIDFGLAVRSGSWSREWRNSNLAGDPRYWTPSAWMAFAFGFKYVATHPNSGFQQQYLTRIDHFSLGILGLEVLFALWQSYEAYDGKHPGVLEVRAAWCKYWVVVIHLFQMFHRQGASEVRQHLAQSQDEGVTCLAKHLRQLRQSLRAAAIHPMNSQCAALLLVLANLIDEKGAATWPELPSMLSEDTLARTPAQEEAPALSGERTSPPFSETPVQNISHRRMRSTGGTVDQELRRFEPDVGQQRCGSNGASLCFGNASHRRTPSAI